MGDGDGDVVVFSMIKRECYGYGRGIRIRVWSSSNSKFNFKTKIQKSTKKKHPLWKHSFESIKHLLPGLHEKTSNIIIPKKMGRLTLLVALLAIAFATNPDEDSFKKYIDASLKRAGSSWIERKLVSSLTTMVYTRKNYSFYSVVDGERFGNVTFFFFLFWDLEIIVY